MPVLQFGVCKPYAATSDPDEYEFGNCQTIRRDFTTLDFVEISKNYTGY